MDDLKTRLKQDAQEVQATPSPELQTRIDAALHSAREVRTVVRAPAPTRSLWWISSLTGLTAALLIIGLMNRNQPGELPPDNLSASQSSLPSEVRLPEDWDFSGKLPLNVETADLTRSLEQELVNLQSDLEKARKNVEREMKKGF